MERSSIFSFYPSVLIEHTQHILIAILVMAPTFATSSESQPIIVNTELTDIKSADPETKSSVDEKQMRAIQLINFISSYVNGRLSKISIKENAQYAYDGFIIRFQAIRQTREGLEKKAGMADIKTLTDCSLRLDKLLADLQKYIRNNK